MITSGDLLARDIVYHHLCYIQNWEKFIQRPQRKGSEGCKESSHVGEDENLKFIAAETEFEHHAGKD